MANLFEKQKVPKTPQIPSTSSAQIQQSQLDARRRALLARGRQSTLLTERPLGLGTVGQAAT